MKKNLDYIIFMLLLAFSFFEFFFREQMCLMALSAFVSLIVIGKKCNYKTSDITPILFVFIMWYAVQWLAVDFYKFTSVISRSLTLLFALSFAIVLKVRFVRIFTATIYWISIISLILWGMSLIPSVKNSILSLTPYFVSLNVEDAVFDGGGQNIIIFNYFAGEIESLGMMRNSGPFWEPGMFAVFLNFALFLHNLVERTNLKYYNIILVVALVTTFSTGGYISALLVWLSYFVCKKQNIFFLIFGVIVLIAILNVFQDLDFVGEKFQNQLYGGEIGSDVSRFGAFITQIVMIENSPFFGGEQIADYAKESLTLASGTLLPFVELGIPIGILYYFILLKSLIKIAKSYGKSSWVGVCFFITIIFLSFSQTFLLKQFMYTVIFIGLLKPKQYAIA